MNKYIFLLILIVFTGCSQKQEEVYVTKKVYPDISKNAVYDAAKTLFNISNEDNGNKDFVIDSYRDKIEVNKITFKDNIVRIDIILDKWLLELYQTENETRANLIFVRRDGVDLDDIKSFDKNVHQLFWDRLDYLLGLNKDWKLCNKYFGVNQLNGFCSGYFVTSKPHESFIQKNILISKEEVKINTIDSVNADILAKTDLTLVKNKNDIFNQSENIEDGNVYNPVTIDDIFETEAEKKERKKAENKDETAKDDRLTGVESLKEGDLADINKQMNKFKEDLQKIISKQPQMEDTDSNKIISNSEKIKENSEFDLKTKEKNK